nr:MAG TPA: hypothetical protein [Caudoviricetes sp.]DAS03858.1 MAG TPA: hypothetical protein [Bacteriophage sp.]
MFSRSQKPNRKRIIHPVSVIFLYLKFENFTAIIKFSKNQ